MAWKNFRVWFSGLTCNRFWKTVTSSEKTKLSVSKLPNKQSLLQNCKLNWTTLRWELCVSTARFHTSETFSNSKGAAQQKDKLTFFKPEDKRSHAFSSEDKPFLQKCFFHWKRKTVSSVTSTRCLRGLSKDVPLQGGPEPVSNRLRVFLLETPCASFVCVVKFCEKLSSKHFQTWWKLVKLGEGWYTYDCFSST